MRVDPRESDKSTCLFCGRHVSCDFRRTFGDEHDTAHRCMACDSNPRLQAGSAAGRDVPHPDPAEQPNRNRGQRTGVVATDGGKER